MFTSSGKEFGRLEMEELVFSSTRFSYFINVFFDYFGSEKTWKLGKRDVTGGHKSIDNLTWAGYSFL